MDGGRKKKKKKKPFIYDPLDQVMKPCLPLDQVMKPWCCH
jgi:hypothetical protein